MDDKYTVDICNIVSHRSKRKKHIKLDRYPWRHFPGWLNMPARRVGWVGWCADRDRGEEIEWQRQQTPPGVIGSSLELEGPSPVTFVPLQ